LVGLVVAGWFQGATLESQSSIPDEPARAIIHDNEEAAGSTADGVYRVHLRATEADWRPLGDDEPGAVVFAFADGDGAPMIPSPLLRTTIGTEVSVTLQNDLDSTLVVHGLTERVESLPEAVVILPGETREVTFVADAQGTYFYWGRVIHDLADATADLNDREYGDVPLSGAFIVDPPEGPADGVEEILLMTAYHHRYGDTGEDGVLQTINGRPWPFTERLQYTQGDSVRWRIINAAERGHPMHLHGFFFRVDAKGDLARDTLYWASQKRIGVTEHMNLGSTVDLTWSPDRPGGWVFHCHISFHVLPNLPLGEVPPDFEQVFRDLLLGTIHHDPNQHVEQGMGGLMMAIDVEPAPDWEPDMRERRVIRTAIVSDSLSSPEDAELEFVGPHRRRFSLMIVDDPAAVEGREIPIPGETLVLREGEPTTIWVVNRSPEATSIHWHGLEIESPYDGAAGVSGYGVSRSPAVAPGDSFQVRITPPTAGSFMYHTHISDLRQQAGGLYGGFVVLGAEEEWDPEHDRALVIGDAPHQGGMHLNGLQELPSTEMTAGETYRLRVMNIPLANTVNVRLLRNGRLFRWRPIAKDGADLPERNRSLQRADITIRVGETADFELVPRPGTFTLEVRAPNGRLFASQEIHVAEPATGESTGP